MQNEVTQEWFDLQQAIAEKVRTVSPVSRLKHEYDRTVAFLEGAGISHTAIPSTQPFRFVFAVPDTERTKLLEQLADLGIGAAAYVRSIVPAPRVSRLAQQAAEYCAELTGEIRVIRIIWPVVAKDENNSLSEEYSCEIEFWKEQLGEFDETFWVAPRPNGVVRKIFAPEETVSIPLSRLTNFSPREFDLQQVETFAEMSSPVITRVDFPIDVVYTWVDSNDSNWRQKKALHTSDGAHSEAASISRFIDRGEIKFSLRSLQKNAPWINRIYVVTDDQVPEWFDGRDGKVVFVSHREIFEDPENLPVFNSHSIETQIHRIPGLSEHFIYFNDDMFIGRPVLPTHFFQTNGVAKFMLSPSTVPQRVKSNHDTPVDQAVKNSRQLLIQEYGFNVSQVLEHSPYPLRKSVLEEISRTFKTECQVTAANKFRDSLDINIPSFLAHYVGYFQGKSAIGSVKFRYIGLSHPRAQSLLLGLLARQDCDTFCLNDTFTTVEELEQQAKMVSDFLNSYYPEPARWEK